MAKIYVETYGCAANKSDSEIMMGILERDGHEISDMKDSDFILINTCGVKKATEDRILNRLRILSKTNKKILIAGCLTKIDLEKIKRSAPNFAAMIDPQSIHKISSIVEKIENGYDKLIEFSTLSPDKPILPKHSINETISIIQILEGCLSACTFCGTRIARGRAVSYRPSSILCSVKEAVSNGYKEIWLTSQDNSCYGKDIDTNLANLMRGISEIEGKFFVRVGMMNPLHLKPFLDDLIEIYKNEKFFKFLHLPIQSGSDKVLKDMRRGYKVKDFLYYVERFRESIPDITLSTDIIVGFPTESESDFNKTISLIKKVKPDVLNISRFSPRKGTLAAKMERLNPKIVNRRSAKLYKIIKKLQAKKNKKWIGWKGEVLIDEKGKKNFLSRNIFYKPIVTDGKIGEFKNLRVTNACATYLVGE